MFPGADESEIVAYLLGELPEERQTRLEERFLRDVEYRDLIRTVEDDLIDDYVHGELAPAQRERFEKHFTAFPHRREKVDLARALSRALSQQRQAPIAEAIPPPRQSDNFWASFLRSLRAPNPLPRYAAVAAAVLVLVFGVWLITQTNQQGRDSDQAEQQAPQPQPDSAPSNQRAPDDRPGQPPQTPSPQQLAVATFVLTPGATRDSGESRTFVVPAGTELVRLRLPLEKGDEYPAYRAALRTASGDAVWQSGTISPVTAPAGQSVVLELAPDLLRAEKYELTLSGVNKEAVEVVGYYYFTVDR